MTIQTRFPILLASQSLARKAILEKAGIPFSVTTSPVDEDELKESIASEPFDEQAKILAKAKGEPVAKANPHSLVIAADQICVLDNTIFSKPGSKEKALEQLQQLQGKTHLQYSAVAVFLHGEPIWSHVAQAKLTMRELSEEEIAAYIELDKPLNACGAYHYESHGKHLFADVVGSDDVIFGLALQPLLNFLYQNQYLSLAEPKTVPQYHLL